MHLYFVEPIEFKFWSLVLQCADFYINAVLSTIFLVVLPGLSHLLLLIYLRYVHFCWYLILPPFLFTCHRW
jgi:hypothetical protein